MALAGDLIGLGMSAHLARRLANGGAGTSSSLLIAAAGSAQSTATAIAGQQFVVSVNSGTPGGVILPALGGDNGCLLADDFVVNNLTGSAVTLYAQTGFSISAGASNIAGSVGVSISSHTTWTLFTVSSNQWIGVKGT